MLLEKLRVGMDPEPMRMYRNPAVVELRYAQIWKDPFSEPFEAEVEFIIGGESKFAFTPLYAVDETKGTVRAHLLGEKAGKIFVSFRPTNFGHTRFLVDAESLMEIVAASHITTWV